MRWGEGKCKGRWEKCGGGEKNVLGCGGRVREMWKSRCEDVAKGRGR